MTPISKTALLDALNWRYATKKFDPARKIPADIWAALEHALVLAPSSFGLQPWKFLMVQNAALRERLAASSWGQRQPIDCSHFVVFTVRKNLSAEHVRHFIDRTAAVRHVPQETLQPYRDVILNSVEGARKGGYLDIWQSRQVYIALGQFMAAASLLGVDTCPMEGFEAGKYDEILDLGSQQLTTLCACAAGYRAADDKYAQQPKVRFEASEVLEYR